MKTIAYVGNDNFIRDVMSAADMRRDFDIRIDWIALPNASNKIRLYEAYRHRYLRKNCLERLVQLFDSPSLPLEGPYCGLGLFWLI